MATATITLKDDGDGQVDVEIDFKDGLDDDSRAHQVAVAMLRSQAPRITGASVEDESHG